MGIYHYLATDKYAVYIWGSYGVTFVLLAAEVLMLLKRKRDLKRRVEPEFEARDSSFKTSFQESQ
ncbi:MAG TPA: heme exporter protein CcmD [Pyrinomonadaceae bacterium]|jgi:heme exporter protein CcmD|nr:heme exporter protein CcmD [Pyrinomonadaceae bacterium]